MDWQRVGGGGECLQSRNKWCENQSCHVEHRNNGVSYEQKVQGSLLLNNQGQLKPLQTFPPGLNNLCFCQHCSSRRDAVSRCKQLINVSDKWWQAGNWQIWEGDREGLIIHCTASGWKVCSVSFKNFNLGINQLSLLQESSLLYLKKVTRLYSPVHTTHTRH